MDGKLSKNKTWPEKIKRAWPAYMFFLGIPGILAATWWYIKTGVNFYNDPRISTVTESLANLSGLANKDTFNCSTLKDNWEPDTNTYFEDNKIKLKNGASAGTIFLKNGASSFLNLQLKFKSSMITGINTNISFKNGDDEVKYAIGDGDFKTVRYYRSDAKGIVYILEDETRLDPKIDSQYNIGFTMNIVEQVQKNKMLSSLAYGQDGKNTVDLSEIMINNPQKTYLTLGFGLDGGKEPGKGEDDIYIELVSCEIYETDKSRVLNQ